MQLVLPELGAPATLLLDRRPRLDDAAYMELCFANPDLWFERTAHGEIVIVPPAGMESDHQCADVLTDLNWWARRDGRGRAFGATLQVFLPDGSALSPDCAWVSRERLASVDPAERKVFPHLVPEFVVEVMSPSDRLAAAKRKMTLWMANGVELGWLIDGDRRKVHVYRRGQDVRVVANAESIAGEGPVAGFELDLTQIWEGLN
jgi:Uma2 family endonuclease